MYLNRVFKSPTLKPRERGLCVTLFHDSNERRNFVGLQIWNDLANNLGNFCVFHLEASCHLSFAGPESDPIKPDPLK